MMLSLAIVSGVVAALLAVALRLGRAGPVVAAVLAVLVFQGLWRLARE